MISQVITGGSEEERNQKVNIFLNQFKISNLDVLSIYPKTSIGIEEIRNLTHSLMFSPVNGQYKAVIIYQAEKLTLEAQNALLKTLEEPPENAAILLITANLDLLLPTVISRCQIINFSAKSQINLSEKEINQYLTGLNEVLSFDLGKNFTIAWEFAKDRDKTIIWLDSNIFILRKLMVNEIKPQSNLTSRHISISSYRNLIRLFAQTKVYLNANVNPRLALENLFLEVNKIIISNSKT